MALSNFDGFTRSFEYLLRNEGLYINDPKDAGGATKYGVTRATLAQWRKKPVEVADVVCLGRDEAAEIYRGLFWDPLQCQKIDKLPVATAIFDSAVLFGLGTVVIITQKTLSDIGTKNLVIDGFMGLQTVTALNSTRANLFLVAFRSQLLTHVSDIILRRPENAKFENGWQTRVDRILTLISE